MYTCGPTVYGRPHIGNYSSFLMADLLRRWLEVGHGYKVTHVKNITDVGHLVADADEGEDKVEKQAREEFGEVTHDSVLGIARKYEAEYLLDEEALNMVEPAFRPHATDYIEQMKDMINVLLEKEKAYITDDGIYFSVQSFPQYGALSGNTLENLDAGNRVQVNEQKKHPADFALWKFCVGINEHHALRWSSPGENTPEGFPGWHIECSAMSRSLLGDTIDIHTGGEDNIFPHHECEIAQSECVTGVHPFVKLWLHRRRINLGDQKMSKSLGNILTLDSVKEMGFDVLDLRYYFLSVHYRTQLKFAEKGLEDAHTARRRIQEWIDHEGLSQFAGVLPEGGEVPMMSTNEIIKLKEDFISSMNDDLNTPAALAAVFKCMNHVNANWGISGGAPNELIEFTNLVRDTFGCFAVEEESELPEEVQKLVDERAEARMSKDYALSDQLRDQLQGLGYEVRDVDNDQIVKRL